MRLPLPFSKGLWIVVPLLAAGWLLWVAAARNERVAYITHVVSGDAAVSPASPTGYAGGLRELVIPAQNADSFHWIAQTQQMFARREWRVRHIGYENAPFGHDLSTPSPYRWWLGFVAWADHVLSGRPLGEAVEHAALLADPALHLLLLGAIVVFAAWRFGAWPAALGAVGVAWLFPFAAGFLPGAPDDKTLSRLCLVLGLLCLLAGLRAAGETASRRSNRWFFAAGVIGGIGLWVSVADQVPVILGVALGAVFSAWACRREAAAQAESPGCWLAWAAGGAGSTLLAYLLEYYPHHLGAWRLQEIHPLYALAWLGLGLALDPLAARLQHGTPRHAARLWVGLALAVAGLAAVAGTMIKQHDAGFLAADTWTFRITRAPGSAEATNLWAWLTHDGITAAAAATLLPVLLLVPAASLLWRREVSAATRALLAFSIGPVLLLAGLACWQLGRWNAVDAALIGLLVALAAAWRETFSSRLAPWFGSAALVAFLLPGALQLRPATGASGPAPLNESEVSSLIARDLAHWLAKHAASGRPVVLAPPDLTATLHYYGGLPGIGTLSAENQEGFGAAARIFAATTPQEALVRIQRREVTHIVVPSWDTYLDEYLRLSSVQPEYAFVSGLRNWAPIPWLRLVAYQLPAVPGYEGQFVAVFEVVPEQDEATILGWQAEYFADMGQLEFAAKTAQALQQRFPADLGALIVRGQVALARRDSTELDAILATLSPRLAAGADRNLLWPRRAALAVLLAQGRQTEAARAQVRRCLAEANEKRLRSISTNSLYRLLVLARAFGLEMPDPALRALARDLLPPDWRGRL